MVPNFLARLLVFLIPAAILVAVHSDVLGGALTAWRTVWRAIQQATGMRDIEYPASGGARTDGGATSAGGDMENFVAKDGEQNASDEGGADGGGGSRGRGKKGGARESSRGCGNGVVAYDADAPMSLALEDFDKLPGMYSEQRKDARRLSLKRNEWASALIEQRQMEELALACKTLSSCERRRPNICRD